MKPKILVICGPTASGKTSLGIKCANKFNGEIISADSMQIYKKLNIGTAKPTNDEISQAKHHLIDMIEPDEEFSVGQYSKMAKEKIDEFQREMEITQQYQNQYRTYSQNTYN